MSEMRILVCVYTLMPYLRVCARHCRIRRQVQHLEGARSERGRGHRHHPLAVPRRELISRDPIDRGRYTDVEVLLYVLV